MVRDRKLTKGINWSKVRWVLVCENCRAPRCVYSRHAIGNAKGPTKKHMKTVQQFIEENDYVCGDSVRVCSSGKMEAASTVDDEEEELPILFCREVFVCNNPVEGQYYAADSAPTKGGRTQTKYVCCHCYSDGELATDAYIDEKRRDRGGKKYLPICKACVNDGAHLVWSRGKKTNKLQDANAKRKRKGDKRSNVRGKRMNNASGTR